MLVFLIFLIQFASSPAIVLAQDECQPTSCNGSPPIIRFPFRLIGRQPQHCGLPGFDLTCNPNNTTELDFQLPVRAPGNITFPLSAKASVENIDYKSQVIRVNVLNGSCIPTRVPAVSASVKSPFEINNPYNWVIGQTLFNCSAKPEVSFTARRIACLDNGGFHVYAIRSDYSVTDFLMTSCVKIYYVSGISDPFIRGTEEYGSQEDLHWASPFCGDCEERGMDCRLKNSSSAYYQTECVQRPKPPRKDGTSKNVVIGVVIPSVFLVTLAVIVMYRVYTVKKRKRDNLRRIQQFLEDYEALRPTRYKYSDVERITDGFRYKLGQGGYGTVYKGKLSNDIFVAVKVLNNNKGNGEEFLNEVGSIGKIHHVNVVRLVGYCADGYRRALVYEFLQNDSLEKYISSSSHRSKIGWEKMHEIAMGIAKGIDYLHQGCNQRILHFDIKPHNILLDQNLNPKVADFGLAKLCSREQSLVTMTAARGTIGYIAPEVFSRNFGKVSYKSDIYSFGMLLIDMVGGRKNFQARDEDSSEIYFPEWMYNQLDKGEDIAIQIEKEDESNIVKRLIIVGLWCIQWYPADRPSMKMAIKMLEEENMPIMPPNPFAAMTSPDNNATSSGSSLYNSAFSSFPTSMSSN